MPHLNNSDYIRILYRHFLGREADAEGLKNWSSQLDREHDLREIIDRFVESEEYKFRYFFGQTVVPVDRVRKHLSVGRKARRPIGLVCETVNICNNNCIICAYKKQTRKHGIMSMETFTEVLNKYSAIGGGNLNLTPVVGDVFNDNLLEQRLRLIDNYPTIPNISVTTNAVMTKTFNEKEIKYIIGRFSKIVISVYGIDEEEYYTMTRKHTYYEMVEGIKRILIHATGPVLLGFRFLKTRTLEDIKRWINSTFSTELSKKIKIHGRTNAYSNWGILDINSKLPFNGKWLKNIEAKSQCMIPIAAVQVYWDGQVSFCPCDDYDNSEDLSIGNIADMSLIDIYNGDKIQRLWNWHKYGVPGFCQKCTFYRDLATIKDDPWIFGDLPA